MHHKRRGLGYDKRAERRQCKQNLARKLKQKGRGGSRGGGAPLAVSRSNTSLAQRRATARAVDQVHPDAHSESMLGFADSSTVLSQCLSCPEGQGAAGERARAANTFNNIERVYSRAIAFSNRRCSVPLESMLPTSQLCTVSSSKRTAFT